MSRPAVMSNGISIAARCFAGSSAAESTRRRSVIVLIRKPNCMTAATMTGATRIEWFSHNSRRIDQYTGRVGAIS